MNAFKQANTVEEVDKILSEQKKNGVITKTSKIRAEIRKLELKLRKRKQDNPEEINGGKKKNLDAGKSYTYTHIYIYISSICRW